MRVDIAMTADKKRSRQLAGALYQLPALCSLRLTTITEVPASRAIDIGYQLGTFDQNLEILVSS